MFKMFPPTFFVVPVAWLTVLLLTALSAATPLLAGLGVSPKASWAVLGVQLLVTAFFVTPLWRPIWRLLPGLNRWIYPDLNGEWDVEVQTNWPRIDATLTAAAGKGSAIDMRRADEDRLPPLGTIKMRARITQSWANMKMVLWNPAGDTPIRESETVAIQPLRGEEGRHGLVYIFEQENSQAVVSDERKFLGAARLYVDRENSEILCGRMWSDRMWRRGMNTAADLRLTRRTEQRS